MDPFDEIAINPAYLSEETSNGVCGSFSTLNNTECNFYDEDGNCIKYGNILKIVNKWTYVILATFLKYHNYF